MSTPVAGATRGLAGGAGLLSAWVGSVAVAGAVGGVCFAAQPKAALATALASAVPAALAGAFGVLVVRARVARPLRALADGLARLAAGDASAVCDGAGRRDEIGELARACGELRRVILASEAARVASRMQETRAAADRAQAEADWDRVESRKTETIEAIVDQVESETKVAVTDLIELIDQMTQFTAEMSGTADRLGQTSGGVSSGSREALVAMRSAAASTRELTESLAGVADQVRDAKSTSDDAVLALRDASATLEALSRVAAEIDEVTGRIAHIARQTAMLALNAGVEAARAGSEGLGFALIAREVRSLADQASGATGRIGRLIGEVQGSTLGAAAAVDKIARAIDRVSDASDSIADAIRGQVATATLIAAAVDGTTAAVTRVTDQITSVAAELLAAHEMASMVEDSCSEVSERVRTLRSNLVKIVRTGSVALERRAHAPEELEAIGTVDFGGTVRPIRIAALSEGGAKLIGPIEAGAQAFLLAALGIDMPLRAQVIRRQGDAVHVMFDIPEQGRAKLRALIAQAALKGARALAESTAA